METAFQKMYIQQQDLLSIHPSASKPSLVSSFWSIHVQAQPMERMEMDMKCCSQTSLPDAFDQKPGLLRPTKSLSDLHLDAIPSDRSSCMHCCVEDVPTQENLTSRVNAWLTRNDGPNSKCSPSPA